MAFDSDVLRGPKNEAPTNCGSKKAHLKRVSKILSSSSCKSADKMSITFFILIILNTVSRPSNLQINAFRVKLLYQLIKGAFFFLDFFSFSILKISNIGRTKRFGVAVRIVVHYSEPAIAGFLKEKCFLNVKYLLDFSKRFFRRPESSHNKFYFSPDFEFQAGQ